MIEPFRKLFGAPPARVFRAPGRVNLIGEHTDYNLGFVMPVALNLACYVAFAPAADGKLRIYSEQHDELREWPVDRIPDLKPGRHWTDYPLGVAQQLVRAGFPLRPGNFFIRSTVPEGSGLSSSAALEVSSALAFLDGRTIGSLALARLCQSAEVQFVGMPCGIMDQYISLFGRPNSAVKIDCRSLEHEVVELPPGVEFVAVNTMVKHELASSAYRERTQECAAAVAEIRKAYPSVESLRDVTPEMLESVDLPPVVARRARHVVTEDVRVGLFIAAARAGDLESMGEQLRESHTSLQHDYQVSCDELDFLVDAAAGVKDVYGARMTGGGFGGCTVNMLRAGAAGSFSSAIQALYRDRFGITPQVYACRPSAGAGEVKNFENIPAGH